jgi:hypothetical protein
MSVRVFENLQTDDIRGVSEDLFNNLQSRIIMKRSHNMLRVCMSVSRHTHMDHRGTYTRMTFECVPANICVHVCVCVCMRALVLLFTFGPLFLNFSAALGLTEGKNCRM